MQSKVYARSYVLGLLRRLMRRGVVVISAGRNAETIATIYKVWPANGITPTEKHVLDHGRQHIPACLRILEAERRNAEIIEIETCGVWEMPVFY